MLLAILVIARATFSETLRDPLDAVPDPQGQAAPRGAGPTTGLVIDLLACAAPLLVLARRALDPGFRLRCAGSPLLLLALAVVAMGSALWASDKFAAVVSAAHLLAAAAIAWTAWQLARSWLHVRLVAGVCVGILLVFIAQGTLYRLVEVPDSIRYWQEHRDEELAKRGWEPGSFQAIQFEKKILAGEMLGFCASPNSFAAALVLLGVMGAGAAIQRIVDRDESGWSGAIVLVLLPLPWLLYHTHSRAALATSLLAAVMLAAFGMFGQAILRHRRAAYLGGAVVFLLAGAAVVGYGISHGSLPNDSLNFRWRYWVGAARVFIEHPLLGVGWSNFGSYYLAARLPAAAEEIKDPHNLIVRAFVELGVIGGVLMVAWIAWTAWDLLSRPALPLQQPGSARVPQCSRSITACTIFSICIGAVLVNIAASVDFSLSSPDAVWFVMLELFKRMMFLGLLLIGMALVVLRSAHQAVLDDRPAPWMLSAMSIGLAVFFLHNLIDFSMFEPGPMFVLAMVLGTALGAKSAPTAPQPPAAQLAARRRVPVIVLACGSMLWLAIARGIVAPIGIAEAAAHRGDEAIRAGRLVQAAAELERAFRQLWIPNADYAFRAARALQIAQSTDYDRIRELLDRAVAADPANVQYYRARAMAELQRPSSDPRRIIDDLRRATELNPWDLTLHEEFAQALERLGQRQRAIDEYRLMLRYNDLLDPAEPKRLTERKIEQIRQKIRSLGGQVSAGGGGYTLTDSGISALCATL
ncbi:O-antigen ligase family protein [Fontivita pretiosa]|uniref:O-antigen ligase family protein n=1 Tax=Fontivita pretiosa TaxID=2989684 RepID=UPI003D1679E0